MRWIFTATILAATGWWLLCSAQAGERISILGSDTLLILNQEWAAAYRRKNPNVTVDVAGGGSGQGIKALLEGKVDIAAASRTMKESEVAEFTKRTGRMPWRIVVALDGIGIYVHQDNPVSKLSIEQLADIFSGKIRNWAEVGGLNRRIDVYTRDKESGTREFIVEHVLKGRPFSDAAVEVATTALMEAAIARNPNAIGYGGIAYSPGIRILRISTPSAPEGIWPSAEDVSSARYPLSRALNYYVNPNADSSVLRDFLRWVLSPEAQNIVRFVGYYPVGTTSEQERRQEGPVALTPATMLAHGFDVAVSFVTAENLHDPQAWLADQAQVEVVFRPSGEALRRVRALSLRVANSLNLPLSPERDPDTGQIRRVVFNIGRELIPQAYIVIQTDGGENSARTYEVVLRDFLTAK